MKSYLRFIVVALVLVVVEQSVVGYPLEAINDCELSPLNRPQRKADPNMALLMAFTSKNKSKLPLSSSKKSFTYKIDTSESDELQKKNKQNMKLIQSLIKNGHVEYLKMDQKTKRDNHKDYHSNSSEDHSIESIELMRSVKSSKKSCYKDVYTNVLEAFQTALKKEIAEYKKCLCKKNKTMTTTTMATTTTSTTTPMSIEELFDNDTNDERNTDNEDEQAIGRALENPSDVICMHKKYAIMLNKFLDAMHCNQDKTTTEEPMLRVHETKGKEGRRHERNNEKVAQRADTLEAVVSNNAELKSSKDKPTEAIMQLFKQLHEFENKNKQYQSQGSIVSGNNIQKRTDVDSISASEISMSNEDEDDEILNQRLLQQLKALFQEYELSQDNGEDETFLQSNESASGSIVQRSAKKSNRKTAVQEDSTESTEATVILKKHKNETKSTQLKENIRKSNTSNASDSPARNSNRKHSNRNENSSDNTTTKIRRRTSSNHKSSNDNREKLSLNVKIPKSSNILVKKIKWD
ncbi:unnamed protein product [Diamesa hyperborea]